MQSGGSGCALLSWSYLQAAQTFVIAQRYRFGLAKSSYALLTNVPKYFAYWNRPQNGLLPEEWTKCTVSERSCFARSRNSFHPASGWHPFPVKSYSSCLERGTEKLALSMYWTQTCHFPPIHCCVCWGNCKQSANNPPLKLCCRVACSVRLK